MFVARRADAQDWRSIVIQTGEDGRHPVPVDAGALDTFMADLADLHAK